MLKHVWFDMAGTHYRETPAFKAEHNQLKYLTYGKLVGQMDLAKAKEEYELLYAKHGSNSAVFQSLGQPSNYWQNAFDNLDVTSLLEPDPVIPKTLAELKDLVSISLFSNFRTDQIEEVLAHLNIPIAYFTHILSGDDIPQRKPSLHGFYKMVELSGAPANEIMYVGDRVDVDIKPARHLGLATCLIYSQSNEADFCIQSFDKLTDVVARSL